MSARINGHLPDCLVFGHSLHCRAAGIYAAMVGEHRCSCKPVTCDCFSVPNPPVVPEHIQKLYDRCCELEEHVANHALEEFEYCEYCCENGIARKADIAYENAVIAWVNGLCAATCRADSGEGVKR